MKILDYFVSYKSDDKQFLFLWLYDPFIIPSQSLNETINKIKELGKTYKIDQTIMVMKIIKYLHMNQFDKQKIIDFLYGNNLLTVNFLDKISIMIDGINHHPKPINDNIMAKINDFAKKYNYISYNDVDVKDIHKHYPLPHPEYGRPKLDWLGCYHEGCGFECTNPDQLIAHLEKYNAYRYGFHKWHEDSVYYTNLTPEKVLATKLIKCPSMTCYNNIFKTPEELCEHLKYLGIEPFWKKGMKLTYKKNNQEPFVIDNLYINDECIICNEENLKPSVIFFPCKHASICVGCYQPMNKCPICRSEIKNIIPI